VHEVGQCGATGIAADLGTVVEPDRASDDDLGVTVDFDAAVSTHVEAAEHVPPRPEPKRPGPMTAARHVDRAVRARPVRVVEDAVIDGNRPARVTCGLVRGKPARTGDVLDERLIERPRRTTARHPLTGSREERGAP